MTKLDQVNISVPETDKTDPRIGHFLEKNPGSGDMPDAVLIGFPCDEGVRRNHGRPGASSAPDKVRHQLYKMTPPVENRENFISLLKNTSDLGNISVSMDMESGQQDLGEVVAKYLKKGTIPVILGGGHETAFGHFLGYVEAGFKTVIFNLDAHTDVRPFKNGKAHSGSPFRQALEHGSGCCVRYLAAGLQPHAVAKDHLDFISENGGDYLFRDETNITSISGMFQVYDSERMMVTFDMDAVDQAFAPGVSAPCSNGLHPDLWLTAAYLAGRNEKVSSFDISEVNPACDRDRQTTRLAALTLWHFLMGLSER